MKTKNSISQLELSIPKQRACRSLDRPRRRHIRASFWFQRMRQEVDNAQRLAGSSRLKKLLYRWLWQTQHLSKSD
jgi:hypothetical protein